MDDEQPSIASAVVLPEPSELPPPGSPPNALKRRQSSISDHDGKRRRVSTGEEARSYRESIPTAPASGRALETRKGQGNIDAVERKRGQRLFGAMLGALSQGSSSSSQRRRADIEKKQQAKLQLQEKEFSQKKKERYEALVAMRKREQKRFDEESMRIRHANLLHMAHFLQTKTKPRLYYKPWELTEDEEDQINAQIDDAQAIIDQELDDFDRRREEEEEAASPNPENSQKVSNPEGPVLAEDTKEPSSTTNGHTDHSAPILEEDVAKRENSSSEPIKEEEAVNGNEPAEKDNPQTDLKPITADSSRETIDENGDVVLEATEDTVIY